MAVRDTLVAPRLGDPLTGRAPPHKPDTSATAALMSPLISGALGHDFANPALLREALTHRSAAHERPAGRGLRGVGSNERLEFVGDRVLGLLIAEWLAERFPDEQEGKLGPRHAQLVSRDTLATIAEAIGLPAHLDVAPGEARAGIKRLANVIADALEAVMGAIYFDGGLDPARRFVRTHWADLMERQIVPPKDPKTALQEWLLGRAMPLPQYRVSLREGPSHEPRFVIEVAAAGKIGMGSAGSKREAERAAAAELLAKLT